MTGYSHNLYKDTGKIACFDFDGTLVTSKSQNKFLKNKDDWQFKYNTVKPILQKLDSHGFQVVIFTNQAGIQRFGMYNWQKMLDDIQKELDIKLVIFVALEYDIYRKPYSTMWDIFIELKQCEHNKVFYCGDACGRKEDFSDSDLKFALNCNMQFYTPEHIFMNQPNNFIYPNYNIYLKYLHDDTFSFKPKNNELLIVVGSHCSGKTTFIENYISPHNYVKFDINDLNALYFQKNARIVVDDTNGTIVERKKYINIATQNNFTVRCIVMTCPLWLALHNSHYQYYISEGKNIILSDALLESYRDKFEYPERKEGIESIIKYYFTIDKKINLSKYLMFFI
jgi:bifunctional polynucleotide phosphatase/kinase